jgi:hypothetical protein
MIVDLQIVGTFTTGGQSYYNYTVTMPTTITYAQWLQIQGQTDTPGQWSITIYQGTSSGPTMVNSIGGNITSTRAGLAGLQTSVPGQPPATITFNPGDVLVVRGINIIL